MFSLSWFADLGFTCSLFQVDFCISSDVMVEFYSTFGYPVFSLPLTEECLFSCVFLASLLKITYALYMCGYYFWEAVLSHWSICLCFCQCHAIWITIAL